MKIKQHKDSQVDGIANDYLCLSLKEYEKINISIHNINEAIENTLDVNSDMYRVDCFFDSSFNLKVSEINFDNPGMQNDFELNDDFANNPNKFKSQFISIMKEKAKLYTIIVLNENYIYDYDDVNTMKKYLKEENITFKSIDDILDLALEKDIFLITLRPKETFIQYNDFFILNNISFINCHSFHLEDKKNLSFFNNNYFLKVYDNINMFEDKVVAKQRFSRQGQGIHLFFNREDIMSFDKKFNKKAEYIYQEFFDVYKEEEYYYILTFFVVNSEVVGFVFLRDKNNIIGGEAETIFFKIC